VLQILIYVVATALGPLGPADANGPPPAVGAVVPDFSLQDIHRRPRSLGGFKDKKAFVVVFVDTECPVAALYTPGLIEWQRKYGDQGVQFLAIDSSKQDAFVSVSAFAQERNVPFPVLKDFDQQVADAFGVRRTPEAFLLDAQRVIRYHGRIDDQYMVGVSRDKPTSRDLLQALDELLAGKPIANTSTEVSGCPIERSTKPGHVIDVTYAKHVASIFQKRCQECHRPGEIGPFSLLTYEDAEKRTSRIREAVLEERMPPWHADPRFGHFGNDRRLSQDERDTLLAWIDQGASRGNDKDLPPPLKFTQGWKIGEPDKVFSMANEFKVPATGVLDYQRFVVDPGFKEDVWVQAAECRPGNRKVVHHIIVYVLPPGRREPYEADGTAAVLVGWAPGDMPAIYSPDTGRFVAAGSRLVFEVHYTPNGTEQTDRSMVGIQFAAKPRAHSIEMNILANMIFRIPPGVPYYKGQMAYMFPEDALLLSFMPHMHLRGVSARYEMTYPDGTAQTLLSVPDYDFGWQSVYRFAKPLDIPKGSKLTWIGGWDNSADNPRNPDPKKPVFWGLQTWDEMQNGWMEVVWKKPKAKPVSARERGRNHFPASS
jgi:peroxiredoxin/mono/diheme cytochrome c family protein